MMYIQLYILSNKVDSTAKGCPMSFQSKRALTGIVVTVLLVVAYVVYATQRGPSGSDGPDRLGSWAMIMLVFVGITIAAQVVVQILFHIAFAVGVAVQERERDRTRLDRVFAASMTDDEMSKLIGLKAACVGSICIGLGFVAGLAALAFGTSAVVALHIVFASFAVAAIVDGVTSIRLYERGVGNG